MAYTLQELLGFAQQAGFTGASANTAAAIAMAESGGDPYAINYADPGGSYGLTQINAAAHGAGAINTLGNPAEAFSQMFALSQGGQNFTPWSTFNNGAYLPFAGQLGGTGGSGGAVNTPVSGPAPGGGTATGLATGAQSAMSAIFGAVGNFFQQAGILVLGAVLVMIGAWYIAKPKGGG